MSGKNLITFPIRCPKCKELLSKEEIELKRGGFLWFEKCPKNYMHYHHYRQPEFCEMTGGGNGTQDER